MIKSYPFQRIRLMKWCLVLQRGEAPALSDVAELIEQAGDLGMAVCELGALRERAAAAEAWAAGARAHAQRFPPTSAQPPEALPSAQALIQARPWPAPKFQLAHTAPVTVASAVDCSSDRSAIPPSRDVCSIVAK